MVLKKKCYKGNDLDSRDLVAHSFIKGWLRFDLLQGKYNPLIS